MSLVVNAAASNAAVALLRCPASGNVPTSTTARAPGPGLSWCRPPRAVAAQSRANSRAQSDFDSATTHVASFTPKFVADISASNLRNLVPLGHVP